MERTLECPHPRSSFHWRLAHVRPAGLKNCCFIINDCGSQRFELLDAKINTSCSAGIEKLPLSFYKIAD